MAQDSSPYHLPPTAYRRTPDSTKEQLEANTRWGWHSGDKRQRAYHCKMHDVWHSGSCGDLDWCAVDREKLTGYLQERMELWQVKLDYVKGGHPLTKAEIG